jgi:hypothetical protein
MRNGPVIDGPTEGDEATLVGNLTTNLRSVGAMIITYRHARKGKEPI